MRSLNPDWVPIRLQVLIASPAHWLYLRFGFNLVETTATNRVMLRQPFEHQSTVPILDIEMVANDRETPGSGLALSLADATAAVFGLPSGTTWVKLRILPAANYAENGVPGDSTPRPVFVRVLKKTLPVGTSLEHEAAALASAIAKVCDRPRENVHILYEPPGAGRVAFGGVLAGK